MPTTRGSLFNKLAFLRRQRDEILVPFVSETRTLVTFVSQLFPTDGDSLKIAVPTFIFDEIVGIDNCIEDTLKAIEELKRLNQLSSCC